MKIFHSRNLHDACTASVNSTSSYLTGCRKLVLNLAVLQYHLHTKLHDNVCQVHGLKEKSGFGTHNMLNKQCGFLSQPVHCFKPSDSVAQNWGINANCKYVKNNVSKKITQVSQWDYLKTSNQQSAQLLYLMYTISIPTDTHWQPHAFLLWMEWTKYKPQHDCIHTHTHTHMAELTDRLFVLHTCIQKRSP